MRERGPRDQAAAEIAAAQLEAAARQFVMVASAVEQGEASQALLRARREALYHAARVFHMATREGLD